MTGTILLVGDSETNQNMYHATNFLAGDPFIYVSTGDRSRLVVSAMEAGRAEKESRVGEVRTFKDYGHMDLVRELGDPTRAFSALVERVVTDMDVSQVRVESTFPVAYADWLRQAGIGLKVDSNLLIAERRRKSAEDVEAIEQAQRAVERAVSRALEIIAGSENRAGILHFGGIPLTSERLRGEIELSLVRDGMDPGTPIVAGGPAAADPHFLGAGALRWGEAIVIDVFPRNKTNRFYADMTRTVVKGEPNDTLRRMYRATEEALDAALAEIREGVSGRSVHAAVEAVYERAGFSGDGPGPRFIHGTGHGVGLDIHELPSLSSSEMQLLAGDVVTVEPGLYDPTVGGIRIEDMVVVTDDGYRNLTDFPRRFEL